MNSETDSVSVSNTLWSILKKSRSQVSSAVWAHSHVTHHDEDLKFKYCTYCTASEIYSTNISFNMWKHLQEQHDIEVNIAVSQVQAATLQQLKQLYLQAESSDQIKSIDAQVFEKQLDQDIINEALISLIVVQNLFFQMIEWSEFHTFCQVLNSNSASVITTAHSQIRQKIRELWQTHKNTVQKKLQSALSSIHLSVDI